MDGGYVPNGKDTLMLRSALRTELHLISLRIPVRERTLLGWVRWVCSGWRWETVILIPLC